MLITFVVENGSSRLGGIVQRGLRIIRQVLHGEKSGSVQGSGTEKSLARVAQVQCTPRVPASIGTKVVSAVRRNARGIVSNFVVRNQFRSLAAEMRQRYACHLISGSPRVYTALSSRVALFGFVGITFGGAVHNPRVGAGEKDDCSAIQCLFSKKPERECVSKSVPADCEEIALTAVRRRSISEESDITIISDNEDDFEIITHMEMCMVPREMDEDVCSYDEAEDLKELIELETQQSAELRSLVQKLCQENATLKEILHVKSLEENFLKKELTDTLQTVDKQQQELVMLHSMIEKQNMLFKHIFGQSKKGTHVNRISMDMRDVNQSRSDVVAGYTEIDEECLRAEGGRVRALTIHRKQRIKNN